MLMNVILLLIVNDNIECLLAYYSFKAEDGLNYTQELSSDIKENTTRLHYKDHVITAV
jgi:hypothetical protein